MLQYLKLLQNAFVLGAIGGLIMTSLLYYDDSSNGNQIVVKDYFKLFASNFIVVTGLIYLSRFNVSGLIGGSAAVAAVAATRHSPSHSDMYAGMPDF